MYNSFFPLVVTSQVSSMCCQVSSPHHIKGINYTRLLAPILLRLTLDGSLFNNALQPKTFADLGTLRSQISLHHSSGLTNASCWAQYPDWTVYGVVSSLIQLHVSTLDLVHYIESINALSWFSNCFYHTNKSLLHGIYHIKSSEFPLLVHVPILIIVFPWPNEIT